MCENYDCSTDRRYRMNEDYMYYVGCLLRSRNMNLFTADQVRERGEGGAKERESNGIP